MTGDMFPRQVEMKFVSCLEVGGPHCLSFSFVFKEIGGAHSLDLGPLCRHFTKYELKVNYETKYQPVFRCVPRKTSGQRRLCIVSTRMQLAESSLLDE